MSGHDPAYCALIARLDAIRIELDAMADGLRRRDSAHQAGERGASPEKRMIQRFTSIIDP